MNKFWILAVTVSFFSCTQTSNDSSTETVENEVSEVVQEGVSFGNIQDGDELTSPIVLNMEVNGMIVEPKGAPRAGYGHHHLLVNDGAIAEGLIIEADETHIHYGGGQMTDTLNLEPGDYKLTLQFADGMHVSYGEKWAKTIAVTVK